jgi:hypothetical protein
MSSTRHWANAACDRSDQEVISWWSEASTSIFRDKRHKGPDATDVSYVPMCGVPFAPRCGCFQCKHDWRMHYNPRFDGPHRSYYQVHVVWVHRQTTVDAVRGDWRWPWRSCKPAPIRVDQPPTTPCWCVPIQRSKCLLTMREPGWTYHDASSPSSSSTSWTY